MGFGLFTRKSLLRGILYFLFQVGFIYFAITIGISSLMKIGTFGYIAQSSYVDPVVGIEIYNYQDDSFMLLLNTIIFAILFVVYIFLWYNQLKDSLELQNLHRIGKTIKDKDIVKSLVGKNYHFVMLSVPTLGLVIFTIIPLIFMILVAFTNYSSQFQQPKELFDWVGSYNFKKLFGLAGGAASHEFAYVFGQILIWTLIWAVFATFTNYFLGMVVAMLINKRGIRFKKLWRTILITTIAVPQFISLLYVSKMFATDGIINLFLREHGMQPIPFWTDKNWARVMVILINIWVGVPYLMLITSGILMNIPKDLYESAKIDGANIWQQYTKITLPYMLFVTGPYLLTSFINNMNNFNVLYLLTGGAPTSNQLTGGAGYTDLLVTWLYKLTIDSSNYKLAAVIGIMVFVVVAIISLIVYNVMPSTRNEEDFQ